MGYRNSTLNLRLKLSRVLALAVAILGVALGGTQVGAAYAATDGSTVITTSPVSTVLTTTPGSTVKSDLQMQNNGTKPVLITMKLEKFKAEGTSGQPDIIVPQADDPTLDWVHFSRPSFEAQPGVWTNVTMTIDVPKTAAFGYYYAVVFSPTSTNADIGNYLYRGANAVLVLLHVKVPGEKNELQVAHFTADHNVYDYLPAEFDVDVKNTGDIFTAPRGTIFISRSPHGSPIATLDVNKGMGNVLPGTDRIFQTSWGDGFPAYVAKRDNGQIVSDKNGKPVQELNWDFSQLNKFRFGRYYAHLALVYNNGIVDVPVEADVSFWVIPWVPILIGLVLVALAALGLWTIVRLVIHRPVRRIQLR